MLDPDIAQSAQFYKKKSLIIVLAVLAVGLVAFLVIWFNLSWRPDLKSLPPDSGFYAYFGKAILHGQVPYRDVWDDKPPLGYYLNALGQLVFGQTSWGVWWSSVTWIFGCILLLFLTVRKLFGIIPAGAASILFLVALMNPQIFQGGNLMEIYSLAVQIAVISVTYFYLTKSRRAWLAILAGVLTACAFLIKQPTIILGSSSLLVMIIVALVERSFRQAFKAILAFSIGVVGLLAVVSAYWIGLGAFDKLLDGAFLQGVSFIGGAGSQLKWYFFNALVNVIPTLSIGWLYVIALLTSGVFLLGKLYHYWLSPVLKAGLSIFEWCLLIILAAIPLVGKMIQPGTYFGKFWLFSMISAGLYFLVRFYRLKPRPVFQSVFSPIEWTWLVAVIALPFEALMVSLGGRYYGHYFISMLPSTLVVIAYPVYRVSLLFINYSRSRGTLLQNSGYAILTLFILFWGIASVRSDWPSVVDRKNFTGIFKGQIFLSELEEYVIQTTHSDDKVLVWHIHVRINFVTDRKAPSRFLFPLNLFIPPTAQNFKLDEFIADLEAGPPELILVQKPSSLSFPFVDTPLDQVCDTWCTPEFDQAIKVPHIRQEWLRLQQFFYANYALDTRINDWIVYRKLP